LGSDGAAEIGLDRAFLALADPIRRAIVARLSRAPATVNELAEPFDITKQAVSKHICPNVEACDGLLSSGMEGGMTEGYDGLDSLLASA
jgi:hypothetical protein